MTKTGAANADKEESRKKKRRKREAFRARGLILIGLSA